LYTSLEELAFDHGLDYIAVTGAMIKNPDEFRVGGINIKSGKERETKNGQVVVITMDDGKEKLLKIA